VSRKQEARNKKQEAGNRLVSGFRLLYVNWGDENYFEIGLKIHLNFCSAERFQVSAWVPRAKALALPVYALQ
jgi:hypothetical protein